MKIYDSMRVRDDLRETGDNVFWVREKDAVELVHELEQVKWQRHRLKEALEEILDLTASEKEAGAASGIARAALKECKS